MSKKATAAVDHRASVPALILFTDIRGFTAWSAKTDVFIHLGRFVEEFIGLVRGRCPAPGWLVKGLGDGAMIVQELSPDNTDSGSILTAALGVIEDVELGFEVLCKKFMAEVGHRADLKLGWGVARGDVKRLDSDYVSHNINKAARLCDAARPFGIVLDADNFPDAGSSRAPQFYRQTRRLSGLQEVDVWATKEIYTQLAPRERVRETPEVHVAGTCVRRMGKEIEVLLARRNPDRRLYPNLVEGCGGQLRLSESFPEGVQRHFRLELRIEVRVLEPFHCFYLIQEPNLPKIPGIRFLCEQVDSADPVSPNHSRVWWAKEQEFRQMAPAEFVGGLKEEVVTLLEEYRRPPKRR